MNKNSLKNLVISRIEGSIDVKNRLLAQNDIFEKIEKVAILSKCDAMKFQKRTVEVLVLSTEANPVVATRGKKLGIECIQNSNYKLKAFIKIADKRRLKPEQIVYMGNDINDLKRMEWVGTAVSPTDDEDAIKDISNIVTIKNGGQGAVRELADLI